MEVLTSLPAELIAVAGPLARGAAPLLRLDDAEAGSAGALASFDAVLALLTLPLPRGEAWPPAGKDLPVALPVAVAEQMRPPALDADAFAASADDVTAFARLRLAPPAPLDPNPPTAALAPPSPEDAAPVLTPNGAQPATSAAMPAEVAAEPDAGSAPSSAEAAVVFDLAELATQTPAAEPADAPTSLGGSAQPRDERVSRYAAAPPGEGRPPAAPAASGAQVPSVSQPQPAAEAALEAANGLRRSDAPKSSSIGVTFTEAPSVTRPEWLPSGQAIATSTATAVPSTPVDMRSPGWQDAMTQRVQWLVDSNVGEARITLHPPELGAVDVEISLVDDKTFVQLTASTAAARDELSQSLPRLRELFAVSGLELGGASVHDGRDGQRAAYGDDASAARPRAFAPLAELADEVLVGSAPRSTRRIDVFA